MKKRLISFLIFPFLFSCGAETQEGVVTGLKTFENTQFRMSVPEKWEILSSTGNVLPKPKNGEITLAASSNELKYGFSNNILVLTQKLDKIISSLDFSLLNNVGSSKEYLEYLKLESKNFDFKDGDKSNIYIFEAKYNTTTPRLKFLQVGKVCNQSQAYLLTIALSTDIKDTSKYEEVLKTFECK